MKSKHQERTSLFILSSFFYYVEVMKYPTLEISNVKGVSEPP